MTDQTTRSERDMSELLSARQVNELTGVPVSTLHDWAARRDRGAAAPGPHHLQLSDRHRRWRRTDIDTWLEGARR